MSDVTREDKAVRVLEDLLKELHVPADQRNLAGMLRIAVRIALEDHGGAIVARALFAWATDHDGGPRPTIGDVLMAPESFAKRGEREAFFSASPALTVALEALEALFPTRLPPGRG